MIAAVRLAIALAWHFARRHRVYDITPVDSSRVLCRCTCGGYAQIHYNRGCLDPGCGKRFEECAHAYAIVEVGTCPVAVGIQRRAALALPQARLLGERDTWRRYAHDGAKGGE